MATWVTHLWVADRLMERFPRLHRRGFCVGSIAPDCNVENEDWTAFTPPRAVTHWMQGSRKSEADSDAFRNACLQDLADAGEERQAFLLGYYAHLIADGELQRYTRDEARVAAVWRRIDADESLRKKAEGLPRTWDSVKKLIVKAERAREIYAMEAEYLKEHPQSGYLTEILPLREFPDYLEYLPHGAIVRKIGVMGYIPQRAEEETFIAFSRAEFAFYVENTVKLAAEKLRACM